MRSRYIYNAKGDVIFAQEGENVVLNDLEPENKAGFYVVPDIQPYQSMVDGSMISSRSAHREHLRKHGVIEIGNETKHFGQRRKYDSKGLKDSLVQSLQRAKEQHGSRNVERAITSAMQQAHEMKRR